MTDGFDQALVQVGFDLLAADPVTPAWPVYDGVVPNGSELPYWVVYTSVSYPSGDRDNSMNGRSSVREARWIVHSVGETAKAARAGAQRARTQLLDVRPVVAGLTCDLIQMDESQPPTREETTGDPVFDAAQTYRLRASPA